MKLRTLLVALLLGWASPALAHGGGLNKCGCHVNHKTGECHCHRDRGCGCACQPARCPARSSSVLVPEDSQCDAEVIPQMVVARGGPSKGGSVHVKGYTKKSGTYVAPHVRSAPNKSKADNYSTKGNVNPATGKAGTKEP